ncbi:MAG: conjugal transfer protein TrbF [Syntrophorhabdus aromaticivorans]|uniref:Conjugal transfer protein TrbF n=1 Tax=Syntrophorhabdus aromaticivorans TaxID=328301 RepID=A0A971M7B0_9BACT|nr:conjugal transfer protein TrbF [Syntrophorhabdus aromaticivorans]
MNELNQPTQTYKPEGIPLTPYLKAKEIWDNRIGNARVQAYNWRLAFFAAMGLCFVLVIGLIYQSAKSSVAPYIVEVGPGGELLAVSKAVQANRAPNDPEIRYFLAKWIKDVRGLPLDAVVKKQSWISAYGSMRQKAALKMNEIVRKDDPMSKIGEETISVTPAAIVKMSDKTYQIRWTEDVFSKEGSPKQSYRMTGLVTIDFTQPTNEKEIMSNPLGLYISDFSWSKEL